MTAQSSEVFIYHGRTYSDAYTEPLSKYLYDNNLSKEFVGISSACWRGYTGTWEIINDKLYLTNFAGYMRIPKVKNSASTEPFGIKGVGLGYLFPNQKEVFAEWYSGEIKLGKGFVKSDYDNFETLYRKEIFLKFKDGVLIESKIVRNHISFYDRIPRYLKLIYESDSNDDLTFLDKENSLLNRKSSKPFKEKFYSLMRISLCTLIVLPVAIIQMMVISVEYIYDNILFKIAKST
ncbi:hypothetical protein ABE426_09070 [Sphingobacterium faecium]|jgi:hypothetical protein|uniref:hypothetical protein n=1 Tax=Sphingobacterium faecium TaxID=34087 RepID=UPI0032079063